MVPAPYLRPSRSLGSHDRWLHVHHVSGPGSKESPTEQLPSGCGRFGTPQTDTSSSDTIGHCAEQAKQTKPAGCAIAPQPSPTTYPSAVALKGAEWPTRDSL